MGVDLGTTGCRSIVFDRQLNALGEEYTEYPLIHTGEKMIEQDAAVWWTLTVDSIRKVLRKTGAADNIRCIGVSSQGNLVCPR